MMKDLLSFLRSIIFRKKDKKNIIFKKYCFVDEYERLYQEKMKKKKPRKKFFCGFYSFLFLYNFLIDIFLFLLRYIFFFLLFSSYSCWVKKSFDVFLVDISFNIFWKIVCMILRSADFLISYFSTHLLWKWRIAKERAVPGKL